MSFLKKLAGQTAVYGLSSVVPRLLNYLLVPLYTRVLLPEEYGVVTEMYAYLGFFLVLLTFGFETGFFRLANTDSSSDRVYSTAFYSLLFTSFLFIASMWLLANPLISILGYPGHSEYIIILASVIALDSFASIPFARLRMQGKAITFAGIKIIGVVINILLNIFFLIICPSIPELSHLFLTQGSNGIYYIFLSNLASSLFTAVAVTIMAGSFPSNFSFSTLKSLLIYSLPLVISGLGGTTNESFDRVFIKYLVPDGYSPLHELGIYGANVKLAVIMVLFIQMYRYAVEPFFFSSTDKNSNPDNYARLLKYFVIFCLFIFLSVSLFTNFLQFLVGKNFREGLGVIPILLLANLFYGIYFNLSFWYKLTSKTWYGIYYTFVGALVTIVVNLVLIPLISYYGAAIARLLCYIVMCILCYYGARKYYPVPYPIRRILIYILSAILLFVAGFYSNFLTPIISNVIKITLIASFTFLVVTLEKIPIRNYIAQLVKKSL